MQIIFKVSDKKPLSVFMAHDFYKRPFINREVGRPYAFEDDKTKLSYWQTSKINTMRNHDDVFIPLAWRGCLGDQYGLFGGS